MTRLEYAGVQIYQTPDEMDNIRSFVQQTEPVLGSIAEVGVFEGASAKLIRETSKKPLYLFDTFEGFADQLHESDAKSYFIGDCRGDISCVTKLMAGESEVYITKGTFPHTANIIKNKTFSFVHIDVDIHTATKEALEFFWPRMSNGGVILVHDYPAHAGVKWAVDEFLGDKVYKVLGGRQIAIWKQ